MSERYRISGNYNSYNYNAQNPNRNKDATVKAYQRNYREFKPEEIFPKGIMAKVII